MTWRLVPAVLCSAAPPPPATSSTSASPRTPLDSLTSPAGDTSFLPGSSTTGSLIRNSVNGTGTHCAGRPLVPLARVGAACYYFGRAFPCLPACLGQIGPGFRFCFGVIGGPVKWSVAASLRASCARRVEVYGTAPVIDDGACIGGDLGGRRGRGAGARGVEAGRSCGLGHCYCGAGHPI